MVDRLNILTGPGFKSSTFSKELDNSLDNYLLDQIRGSNDRVYMIDATTNKTLKISELVRQSHNLAAQLQWLGCGCGTIVGIISENRLEYPTVILATILTGATITCFNPAYTFEELKHVMNISLPSIILCSSQNYDKVKQTNNIVSCVKHVILLDTEVANAVAETKLLFPTLIEDSHRKYNKITIRPNDTATILYSSGTTGLPKGVMTSHRNYIFGLKLINDEKVVEIIGDTGICNVPMFHIYGFSIALGTIVTEQTIVIMRQFKEESFLSIIEQYKIRSLTLVPPLIMFLLKNEMVTKYDLSSVERIFCGAAPLKIETEQELFRKLRIKCFQQGYAMTETSSLCTLKSKDSSKMGHCGSPVPGTELKITNPDTGNTLGVGEIGEICVRGPHIMKGYYRNEKETAETIDKYGWLHTGDIGYYDEDGDLFIVDRRKDLIKYKGFQVAPAELEALLLDHPEVYDAAVVGVPDEMAGEIPKAFVVKKSGSSVSEKELMQFVAEKVSPQKRLRGGLTFIDEVPKNAAGKILRKQLREKLKIKINSKY